IPLLPAEIATWLGVKLVLEGPAGCGKTTWMQHTFFQLLSNPDVFPVLIELRKLASENLVAGRNHTLISYLEWMFQQLGVPSDGLAEALNDNHGRTPILLVDGWDELGKQGADFREKLVAFLNTHPEVVTLVTTRPTADSKPGTYDAFVPR